jgi:hypothetical protein
MSANSATTVETTRRGFLGTREVTTTAAAELRHLEADSAPIKEIRLRRRTKLVLVARPFAAKTSRNGRAWEGTSSASCSSYRCWIAINFLNS